MIDVQSLKDNRQIPIDKVGVKNIRYPITVRDKENGFQQTVASINMYVDLPHDHKGTHMSRFIEVLSEYRRQVHLENLNTILDELKNRLDAESAHLEVTFPYFITKRAPVTQAEGLMEYICTFKASSKSTKGRDLVIELRIPITTVCPCSKEKSFENPMFVEDVVREVARKLEADPNITWFSVDSENFESIHNHSAYAYIEREKGREMKDEG